MSQLERVGQASIRLREASLAAAKADGLGEISAAYARWAIADAEFKTVVDKLRASRWGKTRAVTP